MKQDFKITNEFHNTFEESLDNIMNTKDKTKNNRLVRKVSTIAASLVILTVVTLFSANAAGIINLDGTFQKLFGLENDETTQQVAADLSSAPLAEIISGDVTAKVIQSVNTERSGSILIELSAPNNILNHKMEMGGITVNIENTRMMSMNAQIMPMDDISNKKTVEQIKAEYDEFERNKDEPIQTSPKPTAQELKQFRKEFGESYRAAASDKVYVYINFMTMDNVLGKNVKVNIENLNGLKVQAGEKTDYEPVIIANWELNWTLASKATEKTFNIGKEYNGITFKDITLSPVSINIRYGNEINADMSLDIDDTDKTYFHGVRFKNGETRALQGAGNSGPTDQNVSFAFDIIDIDQVVSIFVGSNFTEIPLQ